MKCGCFVAPKNDVYRNKLFSGAIWLALFPVKTRFTDLPFRTSRLSWNTFRPKGCIFLRELVCMKALDVLLQFLFKTSRSSRAEVPSKSPINFKCRFSPFLWTEILKFVSMMPHPFYPGRASEPLSNNASMRVQPRVTHLLYTSLSVVTVRDCLWPSGPS